MKYMKGHGNDPAPDQRPYLAGFLSVLGGAVCSIWLLFTSHALEAMARSLGWPLAAALILQLAIWLIGGMLFGRIFSRAAADNGSGWLFGISWGYILWTLGPATNIMWIIRKPVATGHAAIGLIGAYMLYGLVMGSFYPGVSGIFRPRLGQRIARPFSAAKEINSSPPKPAVKNHEHLKHPFRSSPTEMPKKPPT